MFKSFCSGLAEISMFAREKIMSGRFGIGHWDTGSVTLQMSSFLVHSSGSPPTQRGKIQTFTAYEYYWLNPYKNVYLFLSDLSRSFRGKPQACRQCWYQHTTDQWPSPTQFTRYFFSISLLHLHSEYCGVNDNASGTSTLLPIPLGGPPMSAGGRYALCETKSASGPVRASGTGDAHIFTR